MGLRLLANRHNVHDWLLTLVLVLCVAMMGQLLLLETHQHRAADPAGAHCWVCATGPGLALVVAAILVLPTEAAAWLMDTPSKAASPFRVLLERRRGPPVHS